MAKDSNKVPKAPQNAPRNYDRILDALIQRLDDSGVKTWEFIEQQIEEAVAVEQAAEELTADEASLLAAYLRRDLRSLGHTLHEVGATLAQWLRFDLEILERAVSDRLLAVADRSRIDYELLREQLSHDESQYLAGEVTVAGTLRCSACGSDQQLQESAVIAACEECGGLVFERPVPTRVD
ncbi:MAG: metalloendopeptidase [Oceanospirillaceae bacterium]|nr:metalloendopeptidase [Oceanospirillaceae bacterium]